MHIRLIDTTTKEYEDMVNLRMKVLLDPIGIPKSYINPEKEKSEILIGAFEGGLLVGCCILTPLDKNTIQLRQMAVQNEFQQKGIGASIVGFAEMLARQKGYTVLMMHARDSVMDFYEKCGYHASGPQFFEVGIGHHKMEKQLVIP